MNCKRKNFILLRILDQIQHDNEFVRDGIDKSVVTNCNCISFEQVFYILYVVFISNKSPFSL